ncbi:MAG: pyrroline-5-carboxylate reductase [Desulfobacterales bacterium]|jgi:pyrroline-5-carboxylate reductase|nr:pyrroline-5-carboxylate reductase [Desulfobacterales bacterium]
MPQLGNKIGFIGAGNMGEAMISAILRFGVAAPSQIFIREIRHDQAETLKNKYGIASLIDNTDIVRTCDTVVFAVKPQSLEKVLSELQLKKAFHDISGRKLIISIAAGKRMALFENFIYSDLAEHQKRRIPILRIMPNTPALVGAGVSGLCANIHANSTDIETARQILLPMGKVFECEEKDMDAVTAMSGSGPAYCFYIVESMVKAGMEIGFPEATAADLTISTFKGAIALLEQLQESPENLRRAVTSPGGTTEAAIRVFDENRVKDSIILAIQAAAHRSKELSQ